MRSLGFAVAFVAVACSPSGEGRQPPPSGGTTCPAGQTPCGTLCVNVLDDVMNCGACGLPCSTGQACQSGACQCQSGTLCNGACVVTNGNDPRNCGACGRACGSGQHCESAACVVDGATGLGGAGGGPASGGTSGGPGGGAAQGGATGTGGSSPTQTSLVISAPNAYWQTTGQLTTVTTGTATVTVNDASTLQSWEGFGGAFNEKGWTYLAMLSQSDRDRALHLLFGSDGARFNLGRIPMGASDYATTRYTLDEVSSGTDYPMGSFSVTRDMQNLIPYVKAAQAINGSIRFWASPWTPPTWMKNGPFTGSGGAFDGGSMKSDAQTLTAHAQYFVHFVQSYAQQGITIEAVAPQNEPNYVLPYPTCHWDSPLFATFVGQYLGPAIKNAGLSTRIMLGTMSNNGATADRGVVAAVMGDATARSYIKSLGYQWGMRSFVADAKQYNLPIWQTEHQCGNYNKAPMPPNDLAYAVESWGLIRDWIKAGVTAYSAWNMVLDTQGNSIDSQKPWPQNALLTIDVSTKQLILTPTYHVFRHVSQFVAPGAQVVATTGGDALAFKNRDGSIVTVMYNSGGATTYTLAVGGKRLQFAMPGQGWATVSYVP